MTRLGTFGILCACMAAMLFWRVLSSRVIMVETIYMLRHGKPFGFPLLSLQSLTTRCLFFRVDLHREQWHYHLFLRHPHADYRTRLATRFHLRRHLLRHREAVSLSIAHITFYET